MIGSKYRAKRKAVASLLVAGEEAGAKGFILPSQIRLRVSFFSHWLKPTSPLAVYLSMCVCMCVSFGGWMDEMDVLVYVCVCRLIDIVVCVCI